MTKAILGGRAKGPKTALAALCVGVLASVAGCGGPAAPAVVTDGSGTPTGVTQDRATATPAQQAQPATGGNWVLDSTFGDGGKALTAFEGRNDEARAVVVQPDGKILVAGESWVLPQDKPRVALARYNDDGSLDETFGDGGKVRVGMTEDEWDFSKASALALQPDGKIVVAGASYSQDAGQNVVALARFNSDGAFDASFGESGTGRVMAAALPNSNGGGEDAALAIALAPDGGIVLAGVTGGYPSDMALMRYTAGGALDESFGDGGRVVLDAGGDDRATAVVVEPDGSMMAGGYVNEGNSESDDFALVRFTPQGKRDTAFGDGGLVRTNFNNGEDRVAALALLEGGKVLAAGTAQISSVLCQTTSGSWRSCPRFASALARYNADGSPDETFGEGGKAVFEYEDTSGAYAMAIQPDGAIVLAGHYENDDFAVQRVSSNGTLDGTFGDGGLIRTPFGQSMDVAYGVALQPDGKIVAVGSADPESHLDTDFAVVRYSAK